MKKQKLLMTLVLAIYILAVMILLYPIVANKLAERNQSVVIGSYEGTIDKQSEKALRKERKKCDDYNVSLFKHKVMLTDPFDVNAPDFPDGKYDALLTMDRRWPTLRFRRSMSTFRCITAPRRRFCPRESAI